MSVLAKPKKLETKNLLRWKVKPHILRQGHGEEWLWEINLVDDEDEKLQIIAEPNKGMKENLIIYTEEIPMLIDKLREALIIKLGKGE